MIVVDTLASGNYYVSTESYATVVSPEIVSDMRDWVKDCDWSDLDFDVATLSDVAVIRGTHRHYEGGIGQFLRDSLLAILS